MTTGYEQYLANCAREQHIVEEFGSKLADSIANAYDMHDEMHQYVLEATPGFDPADLTDEALSSYVASELHRLTNAVIEHAKSTLKAMQDADSAVQQ